MNDASNSVGAGGVVDDLTMASHDATLAFLLPLVNRTSSGCWPTDSDMTPGERLRARREERGLSAADLAQRVGRSESAVRNQENGTNGIPPALAKKYASALGTTAAWLLYGDTTTGGAEPVLQALPLIGQIRAGAWLALDDSAQDEPQMLSAALDQRYPDAKQWLREVVGDSMNAAGISSGDLAHIVDWADTGLAVATGQIVEVTRSRDGGGLREVTLKEVEVTPKRILLWPRSTNPRWKDPVELADPNGQDVEVQVTGLLLAAIRRF